MFSDVGKDLLIAYQFSKTQFSDNNLDATVSFKTFWFIAHIVLLELKSNQTRIRNGLDRGSNICQIRHVAIWNTYKFWEWTQLFQVGFRSIIQNYRSSTKLRNSFVYLSAVNYSRICCLFWGMRRKVNGFFKAFWFYLYKIFRFQHRIASFNYSVSKHHVF